jgi:hypothetical protein
MNLRYALHAGAAAGEKIIVTALARGQNRIASSVSVSTTGFCLSCRTVDADWLWTSHVQTVQDYGQAVLVDIRNADGQIVTQNGTVACSANFFGNCCRRSYYVDSSAYAPVASLSAAAIWTDSEIKATDPSGANFIGNTLRRQAELVCQATAPYDARVFTLGANIAGTTKECRGHHRKLRAGQRLPRGAPGRADRAGAERHEPLQRRRLHRCRRGGDPGQRTGSRALDRRADGARLGPVRLLTAGPEAGRLAATSPLRPAS